MHMETSSRWADTTTSPFETQLASGGVLVGRAVHRILSSRGTVIACLYVEQWEFAERLQRSLYAHWMLMNVFCTLDQTDSRSQEISTAAFSCADIAGLGL